MPSAGSMQTTGTLDAAARAERALHRYGFGDDAVRIAGQAIFGVDPEQMSADWHLPRPMCECSFCVAFMDGGQSDA